MRPVADAVRTAELIAEGEGHITILPGDPEETRRLRELLGSPEQAPDEDAFYILAATRGTDLSAGGVALARARRRNPRDALAIVIGTSAEREALERELLEEHRLEPSNVVHVASLEGSGADAVVDRVIDMLGYVAVVAGRRTPALRQAIGHRVVRSAALQSAAVGAVPLGGATTPVITLQQIRMVGQLATLHGVQPVGADRVLAALGILAAGFGWRALARGLVGFVPGVGWVIQGGMAYGVTRTMGEVVHARLAAGHDLLEGPGVEAIKPKVDAILARLGRDS
jgi:uncharacterized protein (DUF697 family)